MVDIAFLILPLFITVVVIIRKTSAGVGLLALLAGVLLDQLLTEWIIDKLPVISSSADNFVPLIIRLLLSFAPMVASLVAVKVYRHNFVLSLLTSLVLGFLVVYFAFDIASNSEITAQFMDTSGLHRFLAPYHNMILAVGSLLAILEMISSHKTSSSHSKKKKKKD